VWTERADLPYTDVQPGYWARAFVQACYAKGIIRNPDTGIVTDGKLNPEGQCSRAQACVLINRLLGTGTH
jgi:hypothetical protein